MADLAILKPTSSLPSSYQRHQVFITQVAPTIVFGVSILRVSMMIPLHGTIFQSVNIGSRTDQGE